MSLARRIVKGSAEALAWGKKMREIRRAGKKTEREFFGPRGVFAKAEKMKRNPRSTRKGRRYFEKRGVRFSRLKRVSPSKPMRKKSIKGWQAAAIIDGKREVSDIFKTKNEGIEWLMSYQRIGFTLGIPGVYPVSVPVRPTQRAKRILRNPLAVFSVTNPPVEIHTTVAGVIYNICHEIKAEKTGVKKGLYRHPFSRKSGVQILALDNGDLLIHSTRKVRLWKPF